MNQENYPEGKVCNCCGQYKNLLDFHKGNGKFGRRGECKECCKKKYEDGEKGAARREQRKLSKQNKRDNQEYRQAEYKRNKDKLLQDEISYKKYMLRSAKRRAKLQKVPFDLTPDDFDIPEVCPLLNIPLHFHIGELQAQFDSPSLDKIIPQLGYVKGNVLVISNRANTIKNNATIEELILLTNNLNELLNK